MSEEPLSISNLNDFIFCPVSIYFHALEDETEVMTYQDSYQINGSAAHKKSDSGKYSSKKSVLQAISVYSSEFNLTGKIDVFDTQSGVLTERKKRIKVIYDGYIFQLYAQYFALREMNYTVNEIRLYSMDDNKTYPVLLPENDPAMYEKFRNTIYEINNFNFENFRQNNRLKCENCIYEPLCSFSALKEDADADRA